MKHKIRFLICFSLLCFVSKMSSAEDTTDLSNGRYIGGGIVGTLFGFGIGHAIDGYYGEIGWIFTTTELASAIVLGSGLHNCEVDVYDKRHCKGGASLAVAIGGLSFLGLRIWEIID